MNQRQKWRQVRLRKDSCTGKLHYPNMRQAEFEIERARNLRGETLRAYEYGKCGKIHLTSQEKRSGS